MHRQILSTADTRMQECQWPTSVGFRAGSVGSLTRVASESIRKTSHRKFDLLAGRLGSAAREDVLQVRHPSLPDYERGRSPTGCWPRRPGRPRWGDGHVHGYRRRPARAAGHAGGGDRLRGDEPRWGGDLGEHPAQLIALLSDPGGASRGPDRRRDGPGVLWRRAG